MLSIHKNFFIFLIGLVMGIAYFIFYIIVFITIPVWWPLFGFYIIGKDITKEWKCFQS